MGYTVDTYVKQCRSFKHVVTNKDKTYLKEKKNSAVLGMSKRQNSQSPTLLVEDPSLRSTYHASGVRGRFIYLNRKRVQ